jgi:hypothetical protein
VSSLSSRLDIFGSVSLGTEADRTRIRVETAATFHLNRPAAAGWGGYAGVGVAVHGLSFEAREYLILFVGVEQNSRRGAFFEAGVGGGARIGIGYRLPVGSR